MFFILPISVDYKMRRWPVVTFTLLGLNTLFYIISVVLFFRGDREAEPMIELMGLVPEENVWWTWVTSMFVHGDFFHYAGNMIYLYLFGAAVEDHIGRIRYSIFYLAGGLFACFAQVLLTSEAEASIPIVGASGAISACIGAFLFILPKVEIEFRYFIWFFFRFIMDDFALKAWIVIGGWFAIDLFSLISKLAQDSEDGGGGVAFGAHVGGTVLGALVMFLFGKRLIRTDEQIFGLDTDDSSEEAASIPPITAVDSNDEPACIYVHVDGNQMGPFSPSKVRAMLKLGSLSSDSMYWQEGMESWGPVSEL